MHRLLLLAPSELNGQADSLKKDSVSTTILQTLVKSIISMVESIKSTFRIHFKVEGRMDLDL